MSNRNELSKKLIILETQNGPVELWALAKACHGKNKALYDCDYISKLKSDLKNPAKKREAEEALLFLNGYYALELNGSTKQLESIGVTVKQNIKDSVQADRHARSQELFNNGGAVANLVVEGTKTLGDMVDEVKDEKAYLKSKGVSFNAVENEKKAYRKELRLKGLSPKEIRQAVLKKFKE